MKKKLVALVCLLSILSCTKKDKLYAKAVEQDRQTFATVEKIYLAADSAKTIGHIDFNSMYTANCKYYKLTTFDGPADSVLLNKTDSTELFNKEYKLQESFILDEKKSYAYHLVGSRLHFSFNVYRETKNNKTGCKFFSEAIVSLSAKQNDNSNDPDFYRPLFILKRGY